MSGRIADAWVVAGQVTETGEKIYYLTTFIGLAQFSCDGNLILESSAFQLMINVEKSDDFAIATHGTTLNSFLEYVNVRASEIDTWTQPVPVSCPPPRPLVFSSSSDVAVGGSRRRREEVRWKRASRRSRCSGRRSRSLSRAMYGPHSAARPALLRSADTACAPQFRFDGSKLDTETISIGSCPTQAPRSRRGQS